MTTFLLLRHAHSTANEDGILAGRMEGISLSSIGLQQSLSLPDALLDFKIDRIESSPLQRCIETIAALAKQNRKRIHISEAFAEMDYGAWSGRKLKDLSRTREWKMIRRKPSAFTFPEGESFLAAAKRVERALRDLMKRYPNQTILIVTHGDIIKLATQLTHGGNLDNFQRFIVDTCSITELQWERNSRSIIRSNMRIVSSKQSRTRHKLKNRRILGGGSGV